MLLPRTQSFQAPRLIVTARIASLFFMLLLCAAGPTGSARAQPELTAYETRHYVIHTNLSRDEALEYGLHMDLIFAEYARTLRALRGEARSKQKMYLLRTYDDYHATLAPYGIDATGSGGMFFYRGNDTGLATFIGQRDRGEIFSTLQHEGFHQFAFIKAGDNLPIWVNEGLAEYFGDAIVVAGKVRHGIVNARRLERVRTAVENDRAIPFGDMLTIESERWLAQLRGGSAWGSLQYDQAWSICHFLIHDSRKVQSGFERYLVLLSNNRNPDRAFAEAFGSNDPKPFEQRYRKFLADLEPDHYSAALSRLRFLAAGLQYLHRDGEPMPDDLEGLKSALRDRRFALTHQTHGQQTVYDAADDDLFLYHDRRDEAHAFELSAVDGEPLPTIVAAQLSPPARIVWQHDAETNELRSEVKFGR